MIGLPLRISQEQAAPGRLSRLLHPLQGKGRLLLRQPGVRMGMALDPAPDVQDDLHQAAVVPARRHGVHQKGEVVPLLQGLIPPLQHIRQRVQHEKARLALVQQTKIRIQVQQMSLLPQKLCAEGMDRKICAL